MKIKELTEFLRLNKINLDNFRVAYICPTIEIKDKSEVTEFTIQFERINQNGE